MGGIVKEVLSATIGELGEVINEFHTSEKEREEIKLKVKEVVLRHTEMLEDNVSRRWEADANSSKLARNVRPVSFLAILGTFLCLAFIDSLEAIPFALGQGYLDVIQGILMAMVVAYFGGRTYEKITHKKEKEQTKRETLRVEAITKDDIFEEEKSR